MASRRKRLVSGFAVGLALAAGGMVHSVGKSHGAPTSRAAALIDGAVEDPATLVPLTLRPPTREADELFGKQMMRFAITLDRVSKDYAGSTRDLADVEAVLTGAEMQAVLGPDGAGSLRQMVSVVKESATAPPLDQRSVTAIDMAIARLDNSLLAARIPYFVDATVMTEVHAKGEGPRRIILLSEFSVAQSNLYASDDGTRVRTVRVRRLDRLSYKHATLGFVNPHRAQATVLLDVVDEQLERHLLPALAEGAPMPRAISPALGELASRAGEQARLELGGIDREALRDAFADSIERHEVQHRLDLKRATTDPLPTPAPVTERIRGGGPSADDLREAVKNELSGYLAQIAREQRMPRTTLALLLRFLVNPRTRTSTEAHVAAITAEELCRELEIGDVRPIMRDGRLDEERLVRAHRELTSVPSRDLTQAAASAWARLFGRRLPIVRREG